MTPKLNYKTFYVDDNNDPKKNGIYCPVIDRWLLIDDYDYSVTLETAACLSSKIATMVYVLPPNIGTMTNENCLNYILFDKTGEIKGRTPDLISGQTPIVRKFNDARQFINKGYPEDFKTEERIDILHRLKEYADFVQRIMYAIKICSVAINIHDTKTFSDTYFDPEIVKDVTTFYDVSTIDCGILNSVKKILYRSRSVEEATEEIIRVWQPDTRMNWMTPFFEQNAKIGLEWI